MGELQLGCSIVEGSESEISARYSLHYMYYAEKVGDSDDEIVHVDEAEKQRRYENYFFGQATQTYDIRKTANSIDTTV